MRIPTQRIDMRLPTQLLREIDSYQLEQVLTSRTSAMIELVRIGLNSKLTNTKRINQEAE